MILFFYNLALLAALVAGAPWWLWRMATTQKYREGLGSGWAGAMGGSRSGAGGAERPLIWVHAVSVGEVLAVSRLVKTLDARCRSTLSCFHHHAHRAGAGPRALRGGTGSSIARWTCPGRCGRI
jgi:3-deoxy-D-manno-octulosonic-acid transferase